jgi:putative hydrolase of the HAD superfamily
MNPPIAVSFDLGQTLVDFDEICLAEQASSRGYALNPARVPGELSRAWQAYNVAKSQKLTGYSAWSTFMFRLLDGIGISHLSSKEPLTAEQKDTFVQYLWSEQPRRNLWRKIIQGIPELLADLVERSIPVGVLTNSEGRAKELIDELGLGKYIRTVVDSGLEGIEKPDPRIFQTLAKRLGHAPEEIVHVGDSYEADVLGAIGVGMSSIWLVREPTVTLLPGVRLCQNTEELRAVLLPV